MLMVHNRPTIDYTSLKVNISKATNNKATCFPLPVFGNTLGGRGNGMFEISVYVFVVIPHILGIRVVRIAMTNCICIYPTVHMAAVVRFVIHVYATNGTNGIDGRSQTL